MIDISISFIKVFSGQRRLDPLIFKIIFASFREVIPCYQRSTPKYRVKKATESGQGASQPGAINWLAVAASVQKSSSLITARAHEDDDQSQLLMVTSWVGMVKLNKTLLNGGSIVELVNRRKLLAMDSPPRIHADGHLRVSLATDAIHILTDYTMLRTNLEGVEAIVRAWVVNNQVYGLLLGVDAFSKTMAFLFTGHVV